MDLKSIKPSVKLSKDEKETLTEDERKLLMKERQKIYYKWYLSQHQHYHRDYFRKKKAKLSNITVNE